MNILSILWKTPYWVWGILGFIIYTALKSVTTVASPIWRLGIMPILFIAWSIYSIFSKGTGIFSSLIFWAIALFAGAFFGYKIWQKNNFKIDENSKIIQVAGHFSPMLLSAGFFIGKYLLYAVYWAKPDLKKNLILTAADMIVSGSISGLSVGSFLKIFKEYVTRKV